MGHIYKDRDENEKALHLYQEALASARKGKNGEAEIWPMMNMGAIFLALNQLDSALYYSNIVYVRCEEIKLYRNMAYILSNIASTYSKMGNAAGQNVDVRKCVIEMRHGPQAGPASRETHVDRNRR